MRYVEWSCTMFVAWACVLGCTTCVRAQGAAAGAGDRLLGCWLFDDGQGEVARDTSGHGRDGEIHTGQWSTGRFGTALQFDGERTHVGIPELPGLDGSDEMTIMVWVLWEGTGRYPNVITGGAWNPGGFLLFVSDHLCSFRMGKPGKEPWDTGQDWQETGAALVNPFELGRWYHLAATFRRPVLTTYVDGEPVGSASWAFPVGQTGEIQVGKWGLDQGRTQAHWGLMRRLKIYSRALTPVEVEAEYTDGRVVGK